MVKHKREEFLSDNGHRALVISGLLWGCAAIDLLRTYRKLIDEQPEVTGFLFAAILFVILSVFFLFRGILKAKKRKRTAMESKHNFMQHGVISRGKIVDAGGGYYQKKHYRENHIRQQKFRYFYIWESKWWADIEYYDETEGNYARRRVNDLNKNAKLHHLIGRDVQVYRLEESIYVDFK